MAELLLFIRLCDDKPETPRDLARAFLFNCPQLSALVLTVPVLLTVFQVEPAPRHFLLRRLSDVQTTSPLAKESVPYF